MTTTHPIVRYVIDSHDCLIDVNESWSHFARENEAGERLKPDSVIGQSIWDFLRGDSLCEIYRSLFDAVRQTERNIEFPYRCDSPGFRRFMRMQMQGRQDGVIAFESRTIRIEKRDDEMCVAAAARGSHLLRRCSMCNLFRLPDGTWSDVFDATIVGHAMNADRPLRFLWTVCEGCRNSIGNRQRLLRKAN